MKPETQAYSPSLSNSLRHLLTTVTDPELRALLDSYRQSTMAAGFVLVRAEYLRRGWPDPLVPTVASIGTNTFPPACPKCGQRPDRCICLPFLTN